MPGSQLLRYFPYKCEECNNSTCFHLLETNKNKTSVTSTTKWSKREKGRPTPQPFDIIKTWLQTTEVSSHFFPEYSNVLWF